MSSFEGSAIISGGAYSIILCLRWALILGVSYSRAALIRSIAAVDIRAWVRLHLLFSTLSDFLESSKRLAVVSSLM